MDFKNWQLDLFVLGVGAVIFFGTISILAWQMPLVYNSPDENANATFAESVRTQNALLVVEPLGAELRGLLHPRSVVAVGTALVPGSFLGLPLFYGVVSKLTGPMLIRFLTPLLAVAAIFAWRRVVEVLLKSRPVVLIVALALMFHPAFLYYASRSMMLNAPFVSLLIFSAYFVFVRPTKKTEINWVVGGALLGLALWFRTVEIVWIVPIVAGLLIGYRRRIKPKMILFFIASIVLLLVPMLFLNQQLYGSPLTTGYTIHRTGSFIDSAVNVLSSGNSPVEAIFALDIKTILKHAWYYSVALFPWMSFAAAAGFLIVVGQRRPCRAARTYLIVTVLVAAWLWAFYGSFVFHDNPDPTLVTIGNSYVRYWLPIFILISPFVGELIVWLGRHIRHIFVSRLMMTVLTVAFIILNIHPTFFAADGLLSTRQNLFAFAATRESVLAATEDDAIIIVDRADKFLWPDRRVIVPLRSEETYAAMPTIITLAPLYYFGITFPPADMDYLNQEKLVGSGLQIDWVKTIGEESLYQFRLVK